MKLPRLTPEPIRPELEAEIGKQIWQPRWNCFCCQDTGKVVLWLVRRVIPEYDSNRDKPVACQLPRCEAGQDFKNDENFDQRFTPGICAELNWLNQENWRETIKAQFEGMQKAKANMDTLARGMKMPGARGRSANDEREVQQRKQEVEAIPQEKWLAMANEYLGGDT